jgi:predicted dehydrogenase
MTGLRFAVIGCGAIAEAFYLPVLAADRSLCSELWLVDQNEVRLSAMARKFGIDRTTISIEAALPHIDAGVIATPHASHYATATRLVAAGKHVYCEKPLTVAPEEAEALVNAAERAELMLMVNNFRRNYSAFRRIRAIIANGELGAPISATWREGTKFAWPTTSGFYFTQRADNALPPPGVLLDIGAHVIDLLCWWYGSEPEVLTCRTDSLGGPEARASLRLDLRGCVADVELSYYQRMANAFMLRFEDGVISGASGEDHRFQLTRNGRSASVAVSGGRLTLTDHAAKLLANFVATANGRGPLQIPGRDVLPSIRVIRAGYLHAAPYDAPWLPR